MFNPISRSNVYAPATSEGNPVGDEPRVNNATNVANLLSSGGDRSHSTQPMNRPAQRDDIPRLPYQVWGKIKEYLTAEDARNMSQVPYIAEGAYAFSARAPKESPGSYTNRLIFEGISLDISIMASGLGRKAGETNWNYADRLIDSGINLKSALDAADLGRKPNEPGWPYYGRLRIAGMSVSAAAETAKIDLPTPAPDENLRNPNEEQRKINRFLHYHMLGLDNHEAAEVLDFTNDKDLIRRVPNYASSEALAIRIRQMMEWNAKDNEMMDRLMKYGTLND
jgi:hypothetical protein